MARHHPCCTLWSMLPTPIIWPNGYTLYHYTSLGGAEAIVSSRSLWATEIAHVNDGREIRYGEEELERYVQARISTTHVESHRFILGEFLKLGFHKLGQFRPHGVFVASLTTERDLLSQWCRYSGDATGCCLGFSDLPLPSAVDEDADMGLTFGPCLYGSDAINADLQKLFDSRLPAPSDPAPDRCSAMMCAADLGYCASLVLVRMKHPGFREEREWRFVAFPQKDLALQPRNGARRLEIDLGADTIRDAMLGPCFSGDESKLQKLLGNVTAQRSQIPYVRSLP